LIVSITNIKFFCQWFNDQFFTLGPARAVEIFKNILMI
jgi:hypothetical protein